jgi:hypothetical protein
MATLNLLANGNAHLNVRWNNSLPGWVAASTANMIVGNANSTNYKEGGCVQFLNVSIPQGAVITAAYLTFIGWQADAVTPVNSRITGHLVPNSSSFGSLALYQAARGTEAGGADNTKRTVAQVSWDTIPSFVNGGSYQSPSITAIIQEIVDQATWASDNTLTLFWDDHRRDSGTTALARRMAFAGWAPYNTSAPTLHIEYASAISVQTNAATAITGSGATLNGTLVSDGGAGGLYCNFEYGLTTAYGSTTGAEVIQQGNSFAHPITGLLPGTLYHFMAKTVSIGTNYYGSDLTFTTLGAGYPTNVHIRVGSLVHRSSPGEYNLEIVLGGLNSKYGLPVLLRRPTPALPTSEPTAPGAQPTPSAPSPAPYDPFQGITLDDYARWLATHTQAQIFSIFGHRPSYSEWVFWMQYGAGF